jgi:hypothetical protein
MDHETGRALLLAALDMYFERDSDLPDDVHERCIAHRIAVYLEQRLRETGQAWSVDCEYNRMGSSPKRLEGLVGRQRPEGGERDGLAVPDIIVHRRGMEGPNLVAIEVKRVGSPGIDEDREKLRLYKRELGYERAYLVTIAECTTASGVEPV